MSSYLCLYWGVHTYGFKRLIQRLAAIHCRAVDISHKWHWFQQVSQTAALLSYRIRSSFRWNEDEKRVPSWLRCLLAFDTSFSLLVQWFTKLNSQSEWSLTLTGTAANSTIWIGWEAINGGPAVRDTLQKTSLTDAHQESPTLADGHMSAWCVMALSSCKNKWSPLLVCWCFSGYARKHVHLVQSV